VADTCRTAGSRAFVGWLAESADLPHLIARLARFALRQGLTRAAGTPGSRMSGSVAALIGDGVLSGDSLPLLAMGSDVPDGVLRLRDGRLDLRWTAGSSPAQFTRLRAALREVAQAWNAGYLEYPPRRRHRTITVHPGGGAPMGPTRTRPEQPEPGRDVRTAVGAEKAWRAGGSRGFQTP
jgi:cholesterol oxidase